VEQHRGITLEDGIVRIEYQFEQRVMFTGINTHYINNLSTYPGVTDKFTLTASGSTTVTNVSQMNVGGALRGIDLSANGSAMAQAASASVAKYCADNGIENLSNEVHDGMATMDSYNDAGITVAGSRSTQKFSTTYMGPLEAEKHTIVLKLLGETPDNRPVLKPVTVKAKPKCTTCGRQNKATAKFCTECGTALEIFA
jgi:membrane protease subunit (stomatin/prohibitin family)